MKARRPGLVAQVTEGLRLYIAAEHRSGDKLMPEGELAQRLGVSRATLREALSALWHEGLLVKKWGVGTVVRRPGEHAQEGEHLSLPLLYIMSAPEMIRSSGATPGVSYASVEPGQADAALAAALDLREGDPIWTVDRVLTADHEPVFRVRDVLAQTINGKRLDATQFDALSRTLIMLLKSMADAEFQSSDGTLEAVSANEEAARLLRVPPDMPLMLSEVTSYDGRGRPLTVSTAWFRSDRIKLHFHRKQPAGFRPDGPPKEVGPMDTSLDALAQRLAES